MLWQFYPSYMPFYPSGKEFACKAGDMRQAFDPWVRKIHWRSILAWRIPWIEELCRLQSIGCKVLDTTEYCFSPHLLWQHCPFYLVLKYHVCIWNWREEFHLNRYSWEKITCHDYYECFVWKIHLLSTSEVWSFWKEQSECLPQESGSQNPPHLAINWFIVKICQRLL